MENDHLTLPKDYIWNTAAGLINAAEAVVMSMIVTRVTGLADAGLLTVAFAVGNLAMTIGKFGVRNYQVTDTGNHFSTAIYFKARILTVLLMIAVVCGYLGYAMRFLGYDRSKTAIVFAICMIYAVESLEDVVWGYYQRKGRLYIGAQMFCIRWGGILLAFPIVLYLSKDLAFTLTCCLGICIGLFLILLWRVFKKYSSDVVLDVWRSMVIKKGDWMQIRKLLRSVFPLFAILFLGFYENNAPKYAIDVCLTAEEQACYGFVAMPVFAIELLNNFIYQPTLVSMAVEWERKDILKFRKRIIRQLFIIAGIATVCMIGAYLIGIPALSLLYDTDLSGYKDELMLLLLTSAFLAVSGYQSVVLTIMRCQRSLLWPQCVISLAAAVGMKWAVEHFGTIGAATCYLILMVVLCTIYGIVLKMHMRKA